MRAVASPDDRSAARAASPGAGRSRRSEMVASLSEVRPETMLSASSGLDRACLPSHVCPRSNQGDGMLRLAASVTASLLVMMCASPSLRGQSAGVAQVRGTVFDSLAMSPLRGALVRLVRADDPSVGLSAETDSLGVFVHDGVRFGVWLASFLHPVLDSLRLEPPIARIDIVEAGVVQLDLGTPSGRVLVERACGPVGSDSLGVVYGTVRAADDETPRAGAAVEVEWPEWVLGNRAMRTERKQRRTVTDSLGVYRLCGVPSGSTLQARSWRQADSAGVIELKVPASGYAVQDFFIGSGYVRPPSPVVAARGNTSAVSAEPRGSAIVRGRITTAAGTPLPDASVRVLGSGGVVRSNATGDFRVEDALAGTQTIEARAIGYLPVRRTVRLRSDTALDVTMSLSARNVELDTVRVIAGREIPWDVRGIERRWRTGLGKFIDGRTAAARASLYASDALRGMAGVFVRMEGQQFGNQIYLRDNGGRECRAQLWVDGMRFAPATGVGGRNGSGRSVMNETGVTLDERVTIQDVAAIEVYNRPSVVPPEYMTMTNDCGVVAVWTTSGTENVPILPPKSAR